MLSVKKYIKLNQKLNYNNNKAYKTTRTEFLISEGNVTADISWWKCKNNPEIFISGIVHVTLIVDIKNSSSYLKKSMQMCNEVVLYWREDYS